MPEDTMQESSVEMPVKFRDVAFRSRTVVFPGGDTATVESSMVAVLDPEHITYLDRRADFERVDGSA